MNKIIVAGVERFSLVDYPEKVAAVIFMQGCPWRCTFCYNAIAQEIGRDSGFVWEKIVEFLEKRKGILDAVVFSGGEPLVQAGLYDAISQVKAMGYKIGLHTGGYHPEHFKKVLPLLDWVGFDIKTCFDETKYHNVTTGNVDINASCKNSPTLKNIKESLQTLIDSGIEFECRTTCDPRILSVEDIREIGNTLKQLGVKNYYLQKYRPIESDKITTDSDCDDLISNPQMLEELKSNFKNFEVRS